jgi:hypothetical protein
LDESNRLTRARARAAQAKTRQLAARRRATQAKTRELAAHRRAEGVHERAAKTLERLGRLDLAQAARERAQQSRELHAEALREQAEADDRAIRQDGK